MNKKFIITKDMFINMDFNSLMASAELWVTYRDDRHFFKIESLKWDASDKVSPTPQRDLFLNFWELTPSQRRKLMQHLGLLEPMDDQLPEPQRYRVAFDRARERQLIDKLHDAVNKLLAE